MREPTPTPPVPVASRRWPAAVMVAAFTLTLLAGLAGGTLGRLEARAGTQGSPGQGDGSALARLGKAMRDRAASLSARSPFTRRVRPRAQALAAAWLRQGSSQVVVGRHGWLYFRPALEHLTGPPFLAPERLADPDRHADPRPGILDFARQLRARGIVLVVMPVPVKAALEPEALTGSVGPGHLPLANPSLAPLVQELESAGVLVFDPGPLLADLKRRSGKPVYLSTDTHWRPEAMRAVAEAVARLVREHVELDEVPDPGFSTESVEVEAPGDLVAMLGLPPDSHVFAREKVTIEKVIDADDRLWRLDTQADVLLLGDSFANVYSMPELGWGEAAGLAEHVSLALNRPLDTILMNAAGPLGTRLILSRELAAGRDRLAGKKVVIWELAARDLSLGDWRPLPLVLGREKRAGFFVPRPAEAVAVEGVITDMGVIPQPRSAPYADYIVALRLSDLQSSDPRAQGREAVVFVVAMRDYTLQPAARWRVGQRAALRLQAWSSVADEYGYFTRGELGDAKLMLVEPSFGEEIRP